MEADRTKWNNKYNEPKERGEPSQILTQFAPMEKPGHALDLACGLGRNALYLAELGFQVDAWDIADNALAQIQHPRITTERVDLDDGDLPLDQYDLIVNTLFLDRGLFDPIIFALRMEGLLVFETFLQEHQHVGNPTFKLFPNELLKAFSDLRVLYYREWEGLATLVARKE